MILSVKCPKKANDRLKLLKKVKAWVGGGYKAQQNASIWFAEREYLLLNFKSLVLQQFPRMGTQISLEPESINVKLGPIFIVWVLLRMPI